MVHHKSRRTATVAAIIAMFALAGLVALTLVGPGTAVAASCPHRIVSISPTATETLFAIGAGPQVVAVDSQSNYPAGAPRKSGLIAYSPSGTAIYSDYHPDLVVESYDANHVTEILRTLHVRVLYQPTAANLRVAYQQIHNLGIVTCHRAQATRLIHTMQAKIVSIRRALGTKARGLLVYDEISGPPSLYAASSRSFVGQLFGTLGMRNVTTDPSGFPLLSQEQVIAASPQLIFLSDHMAKDGGVSAHTVITRPGWGSIRAVRTRAIYALNDDAASRWGPRITVVMQQIAADVLAYRHTLSTRALTRAQWVWLHGTWISQHFAARMRPRVWRQLTSHPAAALMIIERGAPAGIG